MDFWTPVKTEGQNPSYTKEFDPANLVEKNGKKYYAFYSEGVAAVNMTKPTYAEAYVVDADGNEVARSAASDYSVYAYAMDAFSAQPTVDQKKIYTALLDYSAAVQAVFPDIAAVETYGWADAYYFITENVYIDGVLDETASVKPESAQRPSEIADKLVGGEYLLAYANSTVGNAIFKGMTDGNGVSYASPFAAPGVHTYNISYTAKGNLNSFEGLDDVNVLFEGGKFTYGSNPNYGLGNMYFGGGNALNVTDRVVYMAFEQGIGKDGTQSNYIVTGTRDNQGGGWKIDINDGSNVTPAVGVKYIVDFDFQIAELVYSGASNDRMLYLGLNSVLGEFNGSGNSGANIADCDLYATAAGDNQTLKFANNGEFVVDTGVWMDIRIEYEILAVDDPDTSGNEAKTVTRIYKDGVLCNVKEGTMVAPMEAFYMEMRSKPTTAKYYIDNLYVGTFGAENVKGIGKYYLGNLTSTNSILYDFDNIATLDNGIIGFNNGTRLNSTTADNYLAVVDGELVAGTNGTSEDGTWGVFTIKGASNAGNDGEIGTKYIFETDFKFVGGIGREEDSRIAYSFGLNSKADAEDSSTSFVGFELYDSGNGTLLFGADSTLALRAGQWYNLLFDYEVYSNGFKINGATCWNGKLNIYVNGELAASKIVKNSTRDINQLFESFYFEHNGTDTKFIFDNMYMGVTPNAGTKGSGVYYNKYLDGKFSEATVWNFDKTTSITTGDTGLMLDNNNDYQFNNYIPFEDRAIDPENPDKPHYSDRHALITGSGSLKIGSETAWANTTINAKSISLAIGETGIFEADILFSGSATQVGYLAEFYLRNAADPSIADPNIASMSMHQGSALDGTSVKLKSSTGPELVKNTWYNFCVTVTRTETGADVVYYLNGEQFATSTFSGDASVLRGVYWTSRTDGAKYQSFLFDNIVFANTADILGDGEKIYTSYIDRYNDGILNADKTLFFGFGEETVLEKGEDKLFASSTNASFATPNSSYTGPFLNVKNNALNFGYQGDDTVTGDDTTNYGVDINVGVSAAVGQTYIAEFDFTFNSSAWNTASEQHLILAMRMYTTADGSNTRSTMAGMNGNRTNPNGDGIGDSLTLAEPLKAPIAGFFTKGETYKIRMEITITSATTATVNYYVDNNLVFADQAKTFEEGRFDTLDMFRITIYKRSEASYTIDNLLFTVIDTPVAED